MSENNHSLSSKRRLILIVSGILLLTLIWFFWPGEKSRGNPEQDPFSPFSSDVVPVSIAEVSRQDFSIYLRALGTVTAYNTVNIRSRVDGELVGLYFKEGDTVARGHLLARIDPRPYEAAVMQAEGNLKQSQAQLKNARTELARYQGLFKKDSIARQTLENQEALVLQYEGSVEMNQGSLRDARLNLEYSDIKAPIAGRVGLRQLDQGNLVRAGDTTPLLIITQTHPIAVNFTIPEVNLPELMERLRTDRDLEVEAWDRQERNQLAKGRFETLDNQIDTSTGTILIKARFDNQNDVLFPNQFVNVRLLLKTIPNSMVIPTSAVQFGSRGTFVYVVDADNKVSLRTIEVGPASGERTLIEKGLQPGEKVVVEGVDRLREGRKVDIISDNGQPAGAVPSDS